MKKTDIFGSDAAYFERVIDLVDKEVEVISAMVGSERYLSHIEDIRGQCMEALEYIEEFLDGDLDGETCREELSSSYETLRELLDLHPEHGLIQASQTKPTASEEAATEARTLLWERLVETIRKSRVYCRKRN